MGQVFTWDAVSTGKIPQLGSFDRVCRMIRATLADEPAIVCAVLFGSAVRGDFNRRSDVDCLVIYKTREEEEALETLQEVDRSARELYVPVNFVPCDTEVAATRLHHIGPSLVDHLKATMRQGSCIKGRLERFIAPTVSPRSDIESYLKMKLYNLSEALTGMTTMSEEQLARFLRKVLEAPMHVARKMLIYEHVLDGDSKRDVQERYEEVMPPPLAEQLRNLVGLDAWYTTEVENQLKCPNKEHYTTCTGFLQEKTPSVVRFVRSNLVSLHKAPFT